MMTEKPFDHVRMQAVTSPVFVGAMWLACQHGSAEVLAATVLVTYMFNPAAILLGTWAFFVI